MATNPSAIFSVVVVTVGIISVSGFGTLEDVRSAERMNNAERALDVLAEDIVDIYEDGAPSRGTEVNLDRAELYMGEEVFINVSANNTATPGRDYKGFYEFRPLVYETDEDDRLVYSAGTVFRVPDGGGGLVVREAPLTVNESGTALTVVQTLPSEGETTDIAGGTVLVRSFDKEADVDLADATGRYDDVWINVTSPRSDLWFESLDEKSDLDCDPPGGSDTVSCEMTATPERIYVTDVKVRVEFET